MFLIKQNDQLPSFEVLLKTKADNANPQPVDLTACTVRFKMKSPAGVLKVDSPADILNALKGAVAYHWNVGDTDTVGLYNAEFEVTFSNGKVQSFPTKGFEQVQVLASF